MRGLALLALALVAAPLHAVRLGAQPAQAKQRGGRKEKAPRVAVTTKPFNGSLYFMHLPKAAGDSFLADAPKYCGRMVKGSETNYCISRTGANGTLDRHVVAMVRDPRAHVLSMYFHCKTGHEYLLQGWDAWMPDRIIEWLRPWSKASTYDSPDVLHRFCCYSPVNLQSRRFACSKGLDVAKRHVEKAFFVGLVEYYHVSMCILGTKVNGTVPRGCNCAAGSDERQRPEETHLSHGVQLHSASHLPASHLELIDNMTREDSAIYEMARVRLWSELERLEKLHKVRLACNNERRLLRTPRAAVQPLSAMRALARPPRPRGPAPAEHAPARLPPRVPPPVAVASAPAADFSLAALPARSEAVAPPLGVRARVPARPPHAAYPSPGQAPPGAAAAAAASPAAAAAGPAPVPVVDLHRVRVPARPRLKRLEGLSFLSLGSSSVSSAAASSTGGAAATSVGCPNEGYLLHGTGAGR